MLNIHDWYKVKYRFLSSQIVTETVNYVQYVSDNYIKLGIRLNLGSLKIDWI